MKVLFTTPVLEHPAAGGPQLRIENSILALDRVSELHIVSRIGKRLLGGNTSEAFYTKKCRKFSYSPSALNLPDNRYFRAMQRLANYLLKTADAHFISDYAKRNNIDVVWFGYGNISFSLIKAVRNQSPGLKIVCDTDSVWSRFILRALPFENNLIRRWNIKRNGRIKEREEKEWVHLSNVTTAVSEVDAEYYRAFSADACRIKIFSNGINLETYAHHFPPPHDFKKPCIYLAGTFGPRSPMDKGARWVINEVLPRVRAAIPNIHFYIVGNGSRETLEDVQMPGITITGKLPSVLPYLRNADVSVVPLTFESGTRFKILEAAACGIPIVSTTLGAEGIPVTDDKDIIIADDPVSFAEGIIRVINDKQCGVRLAENCRRMVSNFYGIDTLSREAARILDFSREQ